MRIIPGEVKTGQLHSFLLGAIAPRPICFASTVDAEGRPNLSPFSFFNVFGSKPPLLIFSPARRVRDNSIKHTLENAYATKEVVINVVNHAIVQQMSLTSCEYPVGTDEFAKAGFTSIKSDLVKPLRVAEAPVQLECRVNQIIETGTEGGAGNLILCEVLCMHIADDVLTDDGTAIDPHKIDLVARMGGDYYCRASGSAVFTVPKPNLALGIGVDSLPAPIRTSRVLTGNHLGILGNSTSIPVLDEPFYDDRLSSILREWEGDPAGKQQALHLYAAELLDRGDVEHAWGVLLADEGAGKEPGEKVYEG